MVNVSLKSTGRGGRLDCHHQKHLPVLCRDSIILEQSGAFLAHGDKSEDGRKRKDCRRKALKLYPMNKIL